jgi:hypothetical protein
MQNPRPKRSKVTCPGEGWLKVMCECARVHSIAINLPVGERQCEV